MSYVNRQVSFKKNDNLLLKYQVWFRPGESTKGVFFQTTHLIYKINLKWVKTLKTTDIYNNYIVYICVKN